MPYTKRVLILGHLDRQSTRGMVQGITQYAHVYGPWVFYHRIPFYKALDASGESLVVKDGYEESLRGLLENGQVDGLVADIPSEKAAARILPEGFPAVLIPVREIIPGFVNVVSSGGRIGQMAAEYLLGLGFRKMAFFGLSMIYWSQRREESFWQRLAAEGIEPFLFNQDSTPGSARWQEELEEIAEVLRKLPRPLAIWAWNDDLAEIVIEACRILNIVVPDEVSILGTDNDELFCNLCDPPLSSVAMNFERVGYEIAEALDLLMKGHSPPANTIELQPLNVVERQSTEIQAVDDLEVAKAIRFIRQNAHKPIQVVDVVNHLSISRSLLYERFRYVIGRTIHEEIKRVRVEAIAKALVTTHAPIKEIAYRLGFSSEDHLSRYFKDVKHLSPQVYRRRLGSK